jgi:hypothetical protein
MVTLAISMHVTQLSYVNNADFLGGPLVYQGTYNPTTELHATASGVAGLIVEALTTAIQVSHRFKLLMPLNGSV